MVKKKDASSAWASFGLGLLLAFFGVGVAQDREVLGFVAGGFIGVLLAQVLFLRSRTRALREAVEALQKSLETRPMATPLPVVETSVPVVTPATTASPVVVATAPAMPAPPAMPKPATVVRTEPVAAPAQPPRAPTRPKTPPPEIPLIKWLKGGNPFARLGVAILFIAGVLAVKYAAEHSHFPIELRFALIAAGALVLLIVGWRLRDKRGAYAHLLQGGGIAGLYLTVFAATRFFQLLPFGLALAIMIVIALAAAVLAVAQNAQSLAVVATTGGFLAPVLLATGSGNFVALFTYYAVLNLGVFAVAWFRAWRPLNVLGFLFTFTITGAWRAMAYRPENFVTADAFLLLFFVMYVGVSILNCLRQPPNLKGYVSASLVFGLPVIAFTLHGTLVSHIEYALAYSALGLGAGYLALAFVLFKTRNENLRLLVEAFAALGVIFATLAVPLAFDSHATAAMWSVEGAGTIWFGIRQGRKLPRAFGMLMQLLGGMSWLYHLTWPSPSLLFLNSAYIGTFLLAGAGFASSLWLYRNRERQARYETGWDVVVAFWGLAWWLLGGLHEIDRGAPTHELGLVLVFIALSAGVLMWIGRKTRWPLAPSIALYLPAASGVVALAYLSDHSHPFVEWGVLGWIALLGAHYVMLKVSSPVSPATLSGSQKLLHAVGLWMLALVMAWEASWQLTRTLEGVWPWLTWGLAPTILIALLARQSPKPRWPLADYRETYLLLVATPLVVWALLWIVGINLTNSGDPVMLPYLPLLNPLDISVMVTFGAIALWWTALDDSQRAKVWSFDARSLIALVAAVIFLWLNAALIRSLHYLWDAPLGISGIMRSVQIQAALSIFWGLLGFTAMVIAGRKRWRPVWLVGATLMGIVIAKLFLVDLSGVGTLARIVSFVSVGALLLVTGYVSPLPPRAATEEEPA